MFSAELLRRTAQETLPVIDHEFLGLDETLQSADGRKRLTWRGWCSEGERSDGKWAGFIVLELSLKGRRRDGVWENIMTGTIKNWHDERQELQVNLHAIAEEDSELSDITVVYRSRDGAVLNRPGFSTGAPREFLKELNMIPFKGLPERLNLEATIGGFLGSAYELWQAHEAGEVPKDFPTPELVAA